MQSSTRNTRDHLQPENSVTPHAAGAKRRGIVALLAGVLALGALGSAFLIALTNQAQRQDLLRQASLVAQAVNPDHLYALTGTEADLLTPRYLRLKQQLLLTRNYSRSCRFLYLMGRKPDGSVFFYVDSEPADSKDCSPAGQIYREVPEECRRVFDTRMAVTAGPITDRWGNWFSAFVPLSDPATGRLTAVLGMDVDARDWKSMLIWSSFQPMIFALALALILLLGWRLLRTDAGSRWRTYVAPAVIIAVGSVLAFFTAWIVQKHEARIWKEAFQHLAVSRTDSIRMTLARVRDTELESLARFCEVNESLSAERFRTFSQYLTRDPSVQAWEWIPVVPATEAARFADEQGWPPGDGIWQRDASGQRATAAGRDVYYPVSLVAPLAGNERAQGFDLGSELMRRTALEEAARSGLSTATDPITLIQETGQQKGLLLLYPVFRPATPPVLRGFALAALRMGDFLHMVTPDNPIMLELVLLQPDRPHEILATSWQPPSYPAPRLALTRPVFAFGKTFAINAYTGPHFMPLYAKSAGWLTLLAGLVLSGVLALTIALILRGREELQRMVAARTASLSDSENLQHQLLENIDTGVIIIDTNTHVIEMVNRKGIDLFGSPADRILGRVCCGMQSACFSGCSHISDQDSSFTTGECKLLRADGRQTPILKSVRRILIQGREKLLETFTDITELKRAEADLQAERQRLSGIIIGTNAGTWEWNIQTGETVFNERWAEILGYSLSDLAPISIETWGHLTHPDDLKTSGELLERHFKKALDYYECECRMRHRDGRWVWVLDRGCVFQWSADGRPLLMAGTHQDITVRKEAEDAIRLLNERMELANQAAGIGVWDLALNEQSLVWDARMYELYGVSASVTPSFALWENALHPDDRAAAVSSIQSTLRGEAPFHATFRICRPDGNVRYLRAFARLFADEPSTSTRLIGVNFDVTAQKELENQLRTHGTLEALLASISTRFISLAASEIDRAIQESLGEVGHLVHVDRVYVFMYTPDLSTCSNTHEWYSDGTVPQRENLQEVPSDALPWWSARMQHFDSIIIPDVKQMPPEAAAEQELLSAQGIQSLLVVPMVWAGHLEGFIGFDAVREQHQWNQDDITTLELLASTIINALKRKQSEQNLQATQHSLRDLNATLEGRVVERTRQLQEVQSRLYLQDKMASIGQLAAGLAHEINNPVSFVATNFATLEEDVRIFNEMLNAYRSLMFEAVAVAPMLAPRFAEVRRQEESLAMEFILRDLPNLFEESREGFRRVTAIINSVRNFARKDEVREFTPYNLNKGVEDTLVITRNAYKYRAEVNLETGHVPDLPCVPGQINQVLLNLIVNAAQSLTNTPANPAVNGRITIRTWDEAEQAVCEVADNGPGIPAGLERQIFDPFFTTKPPGEGTGLGLSISYAIIVNNHGGTITAYNQPSGGACFRITLPHHPPGARREGLDGN
ncbi:MAG: PAS domain-containing protein [bacterium]